jgi:transposase-like protein
MGKQHKIAPEVKQEVIKRVQLGEVTVAEAVKQYGVSDASIYTWLGKKANSPTRADVAKLKRENKALLELVGEMTLKMSETQKKS